MFLFFFFVIHVKRADGVYNQGSKQNVGDCVDIEGHAEIWLWSHHQDALAKYLFRLLSSFEPNWHVRQVEASGDIVWILIKVAQHLLDIVRKQ